MYVFSPNPGNSGLTSASQSRRIRLYEEVVMGNDEYMNEV